MEGWMETVGQIIGGAAGMKILDYALGRRQKKDDAAVTLRDSMLSVAREIIGEQTRELRAEVEGLKRRVRELEEENLKLKSGACAHCSFRAE